MNTERDFEEVLEAGRLSAAALNRLQELAVGLAGNNPTAPLNRAFGSYQNAFEQVYPILGRLTNQDPTPTQTYSWIELSEAPLTGGFWNSSKFATPIFLCSPSNSPTTDTAQAAAAAFAAAADAWTAANPSTAAAAAAAAAVAAATAYSDTGAVSIAAAALAWKNQYATSASADPNIGPASTAGQAAYVAKAGGVNPGGSQVLLIPLADNGSWQFLWWCFAPAYTFANGVSTGTCGSSYTVTALTPGSSAFGWTGQLTGNQDLGIQITADAMASAVTVAQLPLNPVARTPGGGNPCMTTGGLYRDQQYVGGEKYGAALGLTANAFQPSPGVDPTGGTWGTNRDEAYFHWLAAIGGGTGGGGSGANWYVKEEFPNPLISSLADSVLPTGYFGLSFKFGHAFSPLSGYPGLSSGYQGRYVNRHAVFGIEANLANAPWSLADTNGFWLWDGFSGLLGDGSIVAGGLILAPGGAGGPLSVGKGGTGADLSASGGAHFIVQQTTLGGPFISAELNADDLPGAILTDLAKPF